MNEPTISTTQLCARWACDRGTIARKIRQGVLPHGFRIGKENHYWERHIFLAERKLMGLPIEDTDPIADDEAHWETLRALMQDAATSRPRRRPARKK